MRLDDTSRKLLRILYNARGVPSIEELTRMAVRTPGQVKMALRVLAVEGFIKYEPDKHHELKIVQAWEVKGQEIDVRRTERRMAEWELYPGR